MHHQFVGAEKLEVAPYAIGPRLYDPETGRFLQPDALVPGPADPQAFNRYAYARNNPIQLRDVTGSGLTSAGMRRR